MQVKVNLSKINKGSLTCENLSNISPDLPHDQSQNVQSPFDLPVITRYSNEKCVVGNFITGTVISPAGLDRKQKYLIGISPSAQRQSFDVMSEL